MDMMVWFSELIQRLKQKSPAFFKVFNVINSIALFIAGIPTLMQQLVSYGVLPADWDALVPEGWMKIALRIIAFAAAWGLFIGKLTVLRPPVEVADGKVISVTDSQALPFSAKKEAAIIEKETEPPLPGSNL